MGCQQERFWPYYHKDWCRSPCTGYLATDLLVANWLRILEWPGAGRSLVRDISGIDKLAPAHLIQQLTESRRKSPGCIQGNESRAARSREQAGSKSINERKRKQFF